MCLVHGSRPPWQLHSGGQAPMFRCIVGLEFESTRDLVAEKRSAREGKVWAKMISGGNGEGDDSMSLIHMSTS